MLPRLDRILKVIRYKCKTAADPACRKRFSSRKNGLSCSQCQRKEFSNESKSLVIDDIDGCNDRDSFDTFCKILVDKGRLFYCFIYKLNLSKTMLTVATPYQVLYLAWFNLITFLDVMQHQKVINFLHLLYNNSLWQLIESQLYIYDIIHIL